MIKIQRATPVIGDFRNELIGLLAFLLRQLLLGAVLQQRVVLVAAEDQHPVLPADLGEENVSRTTRTRTRTRSGGHLQRAPTKLSLLPSFFVFSARLVPEQLPDIGGLEVPLHLLLVDHSMGEGLLHEAIDVDRLHLAEAEDPVDGLHVIGGVPGGVEDDAPIGAHQVDAQAAGPGGDEQQAGAVVGGIVEVPRDVRPNLTAHLAVDAKVVHAQHPLVRHAFRPLPPPLHRLIVVVVITVSIRSSVARLCEKMSILSPISSHLSRMAKSRMNLALSWRSFGLSGMNCSTHLLSSFGGGGGGGGGGCAATSAWMGTSSLLTAIGSPSFSW
ncbi:hypothetical protein TYRP_010235 [Tyrophagus putrescentiae]|nr:hypothetical protein TYRP_010235 [Tyrophagus putrescentiae]